MIDDDMRRLDDRPLDRSLSGLEADIWHGVATRARQRQAARRVTSYQAVVMVIALLGSAAIGITVSRPAGATRDLALLVPGTALLPSSLLLGKHP